MCPRRHDRTRLRNESLVNVAFAKCHVGAIGTVENQRELLLVANAEQNQRGQALRIGFHTADVHTLLRELLADEAPHMLVAHAGDQRRLETKARRSCGYIGRRAADILAERRHILEPAADLHAIEINRRPAYGDHIQWFCHHFAHMRFRSRWATPRVWRKLKATSVRSPCSPWPPSWDPGAREPR